MSAPPGFNPNDSLLPDPGTNSAPIHIMKGGGLVFQSGGFTPMEEATLEKYQMGPGGILESEIPADVKTAFLQQLKSFDTGSLNLSTLKKDQWAILQVIQALLEKQRSLLSKNMTQPVYKSSTSTASSANTSSLPVQETKPSGQTSSQPQTGGADISDLFELPAITSEEKIEETKTDTVNLEVLNSKKSFQTRKRRGGGKPKLRAFAKAKTHGKRK